jgi:hypothetical protein
MATTKRHTTRPLNSREKKLFSETRAAREKGESVMPVVYKAMNPEAKRAFALRHSK